MRRYVAGIIGLALFAVPACSSGEDPAGAGSSPAPSAVNGTAVPARATLTQPSLQPPAQDGRNVNKDRPDVVFDPCTWISDETIREAGFDPATRERGDDWLAEWTFLVCGFESEEITLSVMSGNVTLEEETEKNGSWQRPISVNGREATIGREPDRGDSCTINMRTAAGVVFVDQLLRLEGRTRGIDPCTNIEKTAALIEREIGEGN
ncbi:DUF3558 domain-containing protein [Nocardia carnea]|uniref:DUF3558 domain-containing protein n=1 Tax=Nocardia carnea TaxID=37328 RepID=UPI002456D955|nr:DUF3558 domain-containing protein [Nocardia carnea]